MSPPARARQVVAIMDGALPLAEVENLLAYTLSREADFADSRVLATDPAAVPIVDRDVRCNLHLRGTTSVPDAVLQWLRELVPELASTLDDDYDDDLGHGLLEADITATRNGGFFVPHVDDGNPSVRNRSTSFVLFFSQRPQPFRGGELCIERDWRSDNRILIFDALRDGRLGRAEIAEVVEPKFNRLAVFRSHRLHEVRPVHTDIDTFAASRFTVTGFVRIPGPQGS